MNAELETKFLSIAIPTHEMNGRVRIFWSFWTPKLLLFSVQFFGNLMLSPFVPPNARLIFEVELLAIK